MVMSNSLLSGGQTTLQSGIDSVSTQEFASYDNTKVSGTQVTTALSMFQGRDVAIVIQTKAFASVGQTDPKTAGPNAIKAINYGAIVTKDGKSSSSNNIANKVTDETGDGKNIITAQAKTAYVVTFNEEAKKDETNSAAIWREQGSPNYTAYLHNTNGLVDSSYDTIGTTELGNAAFILSSARFSSVLIKDPTGSIIGIFFKQLQ